MLFAGSRFGGFRDKFAVFPVSSLTKLPIVVLTALVGALPAQAGLAEKKELATSAEKRAATVSIATPPVLQPVTDRSPEKVRAQQRDLYLQAKQAFDKGRQSELLSLSDQLRDYPLYPELRYMALRGHVEVGAAKAVKDYLQNFGDTRHANYLREQWLNTLANAGRWQQFLDEYDGEVETLSLKCDRLQALIRTGHEKEAFAATPDIWLNGTSLPDSCDPVFEAWQGKGGMTVDMIWQRMALAIQAGNLNLANYLAKKLPESPRGLAERYRKVHQQPKLVLKTADYNLSQAWQREILLYGLSRYLQTDLDSATQLWAELRQRREFTDAEKATMDNALAIKQAVRFQPDAPLWLDRALTHQNDETLREWQVRVALRNQDWKATLQAIDAMPASQRDTVRWQYWQARALEELGGDARLEQAMQLYGKAAKERDFYGFLAADRIGVNYSLNHRPFPLQDDAVNRVAQLPGIQRTREYYELGLLQDARREWRYTTRHLPVEDQIAASNLALQWGWYGQSVMGVIAAKERDDLQIRFPLVYQELFRIHSKASRLDINWVLALARQESAFMYDARSSAGALGLLQLLPSTAKHTAKNIGLSYKNSAQLLDPEMNIRLGTAHLNELLDRFGNNRILATAAYNAGSSRVNQWLQNGGQTLPYDIWIETVPFYETRNYVQNVMAFSVIYGFRRGETSHRILTKQEVACLCTNKSM